MTFLHRKWRKYLPLMLMAVRNLFGTTYIRTGISKKKKEKNLPYISFSFLSHDKDKCHGDRRGKETLARC